VWTLQTVTGEAPADAAYARFVLITGDFQPGGPGGAPFFDDAYFLKQVPETVVPALNPYGVRVAIDNSNAVGVTLGSGPATGAGVLTGIEFAIPLAEIGDPTGCVRVVAFINGKFHDFVSNQFLPALGTSVANLGEPRNVDLSLIPGNQYFTVCDGATGVDEGPPSVRSGHVVLHSAVPNPFNPLTTISFDLPSTAETKLTIYDVTGRRVRTLVQQELPPGRHEVIWRGVDESGERVASGVYLYRLRAGSHVETRRMTLMK
jgi:hypothetical protein